VVGSDFSGMLTQAELDILDAHQTDIINFLNAGGGLYGISEGRRLLRSDNARPLGFLPFVTTEDQRTKGSQVYGDSIRSGSWIGGWGY
jgi:hypothetical protein